MKKEKLDFFLVSETLLCGLILLSAMLRQSALSSALFSMTFLLVLAQFALWLSRRMGLLGAAALLLGILSVAMVCVNAIMKRQRPGLSYFNEAVIFLATVCYLYLAATTKINRRTALWLRKGWLCVALLFPLAYFCFPLEAAPAGLTLNLTNPNLTGLWLAVLTIHCLLALSLPGLWRILAFFGAWMDAYLLFLTRSRSAMFGLAFFFLLALLVRLRRRLPDWLLWAANLLPLLAVPAIYLFVQPVIEKGWLDFLVSEGKPLDSRLIVWDQCFAGLRGAWLTGNYAALRGNAHNTGMVVLCSFGAPALAATLGYLFAILRRVRNAAGERWQMCALAGFCAVLVMGAGEGALFSGGLGIYLPACGLLFLADGDWTAQAEQKEASVKSGNAKL